MVGEARPGTSQHDEAGSFRPDEVRTGDWLSGVAPEQRSDRTRRTHPRRVRRRLAHASRRDRPECGIPVAGHGFARLRWTMRRRLQAALGTEVPASLIFAHPTVAALAEGLVEVWLGDRSIKRRSGRPPYPG